MKIIVAIFVAFIGLANLYDALMILNGTFLPPYDVLGLEASKLTYLAYKILSGLAMVIIAVLTWRSHYEVNKEGDGRGQKAEGCSEQSDTHAPPLSHAAKRSEAKRIEK